MNFSNMITVLLLAIGSQAFSLKGSSNQIMSSYETISAEGRVLKKKLKGPEARECEISESKAKVEVACKTTNVAEEADKTSVEEVEEEEQDEQEAIEDEEPKEENEEEEPEEDEPAEEDKEQEAEDEDLEEEDPEARRLEDINVRGIVIEPAFEIKDKIKYTVASGKDGIEVKVKYEQEFEELDGAEEEIEGESTTEFKIVFESVIEYAKPADLNITSLEEQAYEWDTDEVLQTLTFEKWTDFSAVLNDADGVVSHFMAVSADQVIAFNFTVSRANQGEKLTANTMKIDVHIVGFPWLRDDTFLALTSTVTSKLDVDLKYDEDATALLEHDELEQFHNVIAAEDVQIPFAGAPDTLGYGFDAVGSYTWESLAEVIDDSNITLSDGIDTIAIGKSFESQSAALGEAAQSIQVVATSPMNMGNETSKSIAYSFVGSAVHNASHIYWDPEAGISYEESEERGYILGSNGEPMTDMSSSAHAVGYMGALAFAMAWLFM